MKNRLLVTGHSLTGQARSKLLLTLDYMWCYNAPFSLCTRASVPPPPVGSSLVGANGAIGIRMLNRNRFFDPSYLALGLHPKVAILYFDVYNKPVPKARIDSARAWLKEHVTFHLGMEETLIQRTRARSAAGPSTRRYED